MKVLLTGFEPWGTIRVNPSGDVARALGGHVLPVDYDGAGRMLRRLIAKERPDAIVMLGLAERRRSIELEAVAVNIDHCEERRQRRWRKAIRKGPLALASTLPLDRLFRRLKASRIPVRISHHAGTFICNHVFYVGLAATDVPCGFVHLPPFKAVPRARQVRAVELILKELGRPASP